MNEEQKSAGTSKREEYESEYSSLYKSSRTFDQTKEERRHLFLERQKEKRRSGFDDKRTLQELFQDQHDTQMEFETAQNTRKKISRKNPFKYKLMSADWLTDVPDDLETNWIFKMCPNDCVRLLVVAYKAITTCYHQNGHISFRFKSGLPGGSGDTSPHKFTVLDCEYNIALKTFYIFDALAWNSMTLIDAEAQLRFFWLQSKIQEDFESINRGANKFILMNFQPAEKTLIQDAFFDDFIVNDQTIPYKGIIFYHKEGHYIFGATPLVGWLRSFMVAEILQINVNASHLQDKPLDYSGVDDYITKTKNKKSRYRDRGKDNSKLCEVEMEDLEEPIMELDV